MYNFQALLALQTIKPELHTAEIGSGALIQAQWVPKAKQTGCTGKREQKKKQRTRVK